MLFFAVHISYIPPRANRTRSAASRASRPPPMFRRAAPSRRLGYRNDTRTLFVAKCVLESLFKSALSVQTGWNHRPTTLRRRRAALLLSATRGANELRKAPREPKNQSAGRRPAGPPSEPPLLLFPRAARSLLELAVQGVLAEVRVVLHELQALGGVAAVLRRRERARANRRVEEVSLGKRGEVSERAARVGGKSQRLPSPSRRA